MRRLLPIALIATVVLPLLAFGLFPMILVIARAFDGLDALSEPTALWTTLSLSFGVTAFTLLVGVPAAFALARCELPGQRRLLRSASDRSVTVSGSSRPTASVLAE